VTKAWEKIHSMIGAPIVEEPFFDYKRSATSLPSPRLGDENRKNLEKAISGFANSEGVIIWALIVAIPKGDVPTSTVLITDPVALKSAGAASAELGASFGV
jgi:hypothetical protein